MPQLVENPTKIADEHYLLKIKKENLVSVPGQFVNIKAGNGLDPLLRRPFSIFNQQDDILEIVVRVIGKGTELICTMEAGDIDILGPLGNGFTLTENKKTLLVGGGVGNAPLYYLAKELKKKDNTVTFIYGSRSENYIYCEDEFKSACDEFIVTTDDGSKGKKGYVTDVAKELLTSDTFDMIYTCGPTVMMSNVVKLTGNVPCEVSVENYFGCGIGLCVGCTVNTKDGFKRACVDGPVFAGDYILLEEEQ